MLNLNSPIYWNDHLLVWKSENKEYGGVGCTEYKLSRADGGKITIRRVNDDNSDHIDYHYESINFDPKLDNLGWSSNFDPSVIYNKEDRPQPLPPISKPFEGLGIF